mmetsp:Transcript_22951/g.73441  ORF Transcript_22951/g.73441 Transcript_22951/m.73441 type:complete len:172 (+) Transcript_22951:231-746(+)
MSLSRPPGCTNTDLAPHTCVGSLPLNLPAPAAVAYRLPATLVHRSENRVPLTGTWLWRRLHDATLDDAVMSKAKLSGAVLSDASLKRVNCGQCKLDRADLTRAVLEFSDFSGADVASASFIKANLLGASFKDATVSGADFRGAVLDSVDFTGAVGVADARFDQASLPLGRR